MRVIRSRTFILAPSTAEPWTALDMKGAEDFILRELHVAFQSGVGFILRVRMLRGGVPVVPEAGYLMADGGILSMHPDVVWHAGEPVVVEASNSSPTATATVVVHIVGDLVRPGAREEGA